MKMCKKIKVAFLSAECAPIMKVGGLGDVVGSLPLALQKLGVQVAIFLPLNKDVNLRKWHAKKAGQLVVEYEGKSQKVEVYKTKLPQSKVEVYLLSNEKYFNKEDIYSGGLKKFLFYSLVSLEAMKALSRPALREGRGGMKKPDIIHCHDNHTAMVPNILRTAYSGDNFFAKTKTVFTIHNLDYQGRQNPNILENIDRDIDQLATVVNDIKDGDVNFMVQGILTADIITTVSPTYAKEILTKEFGSGLDNILKKRKRDLYGILNGIDVGFFNPATDRNIKQNYNIKTFPPEADQPWAEKHESIKTLEHENTPKENKFPTGQAKTLKHKNKTWLQKKVGLPQDEKVCVIGFISRLVQQKGVELITDRVAKLNCQFVILGTGEKKYEQQLKKLAKKYPKNFSAQIKFDIKLAQEIYAGSDIFLMPSRFEPCGLGQMIAMRYGTVPVVRGVGGLRDTVSEFRINPPDRLRQQVGHGNLELRNANGFVFKKFDSSELQKTLQRALDVYYNKPNQWRKLQINGMKKDFSWDKSAREYVKLYKRLSN